MVASTLLQIAQLVQPVAHEWTVNNYAFHSLGSFLSQFLKCLLKYILCNMKSTHFRITFWWVFVDTYTCIVTITIKIMEHAYYQKVLLYIMSGSLLLPTSTIRNAAWGFLCGPQADGLWPLLQSIPGYSRLPFPLLLSIKGIQLFSILHRSAEIMIMYFPAFGIKI